MLCEADTRQACQYSEADHRRAMLRASAPRWPMADTTERRMYALSDKPFTFEVFLLFRCIR
jgi:hypothetical protein